MSTLPLTERTATDLSRMLEAGDVQAVEVSEAFLDRIASVDSQVGSFLRVDRESVLEQARMIDRRRAAGEPLGPLAGIPVAVKDVLCTEGQPTTCGSKMLEHFIPPYDATVVQRLKQADAILLGKTNMDEFAMGSSTENSALQTTRNPWDLERVPGGSSGGAAACLAASLTPLSIGTDTGGSIRQPASFCGVVGLKPTYGRVSRYGLVAFASSLDQVGPMARTVEDAAALLQVIAGHDPRDSTSAPVDLPDYHAPLRQPLEGVRVGIVREHLEDGVDPEVAAAVQTAIRTLEQQGATIQDVSLPHNRYAIATYYIIAPSEASSNLSRYDGVHYGHRTDEAEMSTQLEAERRALVADGKEDEAEALDSPLVRMYRRSRAEGFGSEVKRRIMLGTYALSQGYYDAYYLKALKVRRLIRQDYDQAFEKVDVLLGPVTPTPAYRLGEKVDDPLSMYLADLFTVSANLAGVPGLAVPCGFTSAGLPVGLHLQAPAFAEETLLRVGHLYQQHTDWHEKRPNLP